jgi:hypothetical protein
MDHPKDICAHIAEVIRHGSRSGRLISAEEIRTEVEGQGFPQSEDCEGETHFEIMLKQALLQTPDLREIVGLNGGAHYYSIHSLSETYARILALKLDGPFRLIAETVRENSRLYPRPVPLAGFEDPPFDMPRETILDCLQTMADDADYQDIAQTTTSVGTPYLYSTRHLDPDHASMLAEWSDVGQAGNP